MNKKMQEIQKILRHYPRPYVTEIELKNLLVGTPDSRQSKIKRLLAKGWLLHIRRGLYCLTENSGYLKKPHPYELAQYIYGPSYISLESALSFHQLIPEAVYTVTSVTGKRAKNFATPLGNFSYQKLPLENLYTGVTLIKENEHQFFMAQPWKAICDYIFCYRKDWQTLEPFIKSLRLNLENLPLIHPADLLELEEYYHQQRVTTFLKNICKARNLTL